MNEQELRNKDPYFQIGWHRGDAKGKQVEIDTLKRVIEDLNAEIRELRQRNYELEDALE